jgi:L-malate glycosyltransferase
MVAIPDEEVLPEAFGVVRTVRTGTRDQAMKILVLPEGYPTEDQPARGYFVKELVRALSPLDDVRVLYTTLRLSPHGPKRITISEDLEDGIVTWRSEYGWMPGLLHGRATRHLVTERSSGDESSGIQEGHAAARSTSLRSGVSKALREARYVLYCAIMMFSLVRVIRSGWRPDLIHAVTHYPGLPAVLVGWLYGIPVVIAEYNSMIGQHTISPMTRRKMRFSLGRADAVMPCSLFLEDALRDYVVCKRSEVVPYPVDTDRFQPSSRVEREGGLKQMLAVSSLVPRKGIHYLLLSLALIAEERRDFRVEVIGDGPMRKEYESTTKALGIEDLVIFTPGLAQHEALASRMMSCDFFVHPSTYESLGVVIIEAMACGKPLVYTDLGPYHEMFEGDVGIGVAPGAVDQLAGAIDYMLDHFQDYDSEAIAACAGRRFSRGVIAQTLHELYQSVVTEDNR